MTIMHIAIPDDLVDAFEKKFPGETIEQAVQRLLRAEVGGVSPTAETRNDKPTGTASRTPDEVAAFMEDLRKLRESTPPTSNEEIWALRQELRS
jgi:hypothetical protein